MWNSNIMNTLKTTCCCFEKLYRMFLLQKVCKTEKYIASHVLMCLPYMRCYPTLKTVHRGDWATLSYVIVTMTISALWMFNQKYVVSQVEFQGWKLNIHNYEYIPNSLRALPIKRSIWIWTITSLLTLNPIQIYSWIGMNN